MQLRSCFKLLPWTCLNLLPAWRQDLLLKDVALVMMVTGLAKLCEEFDPLHGK